MLQALREGIGWSAWLGAKFFWAVPGATSAVVVATLVAQVSLLLAFFLPLKVIILLGSEGIPRYFPPSFAALDRDVLIGWLSVAAVGAYVLYLLADRIVELGSERGARRLLARSRKMVLFEGQEEMASNAYKRYAGALAGGLFVILVVLVLFWLYPAVAWLMLGYAALVAMALLLGQGVSIRFREGLEERLGNVLAVLGAAGFMLGFVYLVTDFLYGNPPGLIPAIIALLLLRQAFGRLSGLVPALIRLYSERAKLDALFFYRRVFLPQGPDSKKAVWPLFLPERRAEWVPQVLEAMTGEPWPADGTIDWYELAQPCVFALQCREPGGRRYLIKVFDTKCSGQARHEATLLSEGPAGLPLPGWIGATEVRGFQCHVLLLDGEAQPPNGNPKELMKDVRANLLRLGPDDALVAQYARSRAFLWQRLDDALLEPLRVATDEDTERYLQELRTRLATWQGYLRKTPLVFHNPDLHPASLMQVDEADIIPLHWGRWAMEPAGAGWSGTPKGRQELSAAAEEAREHRPALGDVPDDRLVLAALTADLESDLRHRKYVDAVKRLKPVMDCLNRLENDGEQVAD